METIYNDDERTSGFDESREEYQQVRECVRSGNIRDIIVNYKRRIAWDIDDAMRLVFDLQEHDVEAHTYQEGKLDLSDPVRAAVEVFQAASEHESKKKEIVRAREAVQQGIKNGFDNGRPPLGFRFNDAGEYWVPDREVVSRMSSMR